MRLVEYAFYWLPPRLGGKPRRSRLKMTADEAAARGALGIVPGSSEIREVAETVEEYRHAMTLYQSASGESARRPKG
jgi:hypothetical protein